MKLQQQQQQRQKQRQLQQQQQQRQIFTQTNILIEQQRRQCDYSDSGVNNEDRLQDLATCVFGLCRTLILLDHRKEGPLISGPSVGQVR